MAKVVKITLNDEKRYYLQNSVVSGTVSLNIVKAKKYKRLGVKLYGRAQVGWTEGAGSSSTNYSNLIIYVEEDTELWNEDVNGELIPGYYSYSFEYRLPENIPPTVDASKGQVKYEIEARLSMHGFLNSGYKVVVPIPVKDLTDQLSPCMQPASLEETTRVKFCCFDSGSVTVTSTLPHTGFSPGDSVPMNIYIENQTTTTVWVNSFLCKEEIFTATGGHKLVKVKNLAFTSSPRVPPGGLESFEGQILRILEDVPDTQTSCSCINIVYCIVMRVVASGGKKGKDMKMPLVIANPPDQRVECNSLKIK